MRSVRGDNFVLVCSFEDRHILYSAAMQATVAAAIAIFQKSKSLSGQIGKIDFANSVHQMDVTKTLKT